VAAASPRGVEAARGEQVPVPRSAEPTTRQRVFVKITRQAEEDASLLVSLKALLQEHPGAMPTVLFYESNQRLLALSDAYSIKPSPQLFDQMESMLGEGTVKVK
jgi:DNA polymerase-3 subunit alpha